MIICRKKSEIIQFLREEKRKGKRIGFVPTMGALHDGHMSLIRASREENDISVCSIYVNPSQFNNSEDYAKYPVRLEEDVERLKSGNCDALFTPENDEMYPENYSANISFDFGYLETVGEGKYRPGHFKGVGLIVSKLFNIIQPDKAYFGQKDLQQFAIIRKLVQDLSYPIQLRRMPILREADGLALSSRNLRISPDNRKQATLFYKALIKARELLTGGSDLGTIKEFIGNLFPADSVLQLEYFELFNADTFELIAEYRNQPNLAFCIAGYCGKVRLIDNLLINE